MRIGRTLPPAAAHIALRDIAAGFAAMLDGPGALDRFEREVREYFGVKHCFLVSSGQAAFTLILTALKTLFPSRDEVLIPAFTCFSVPSSIVRAGLRIRLCDVRPDCFDFDFAQLSTVSTDKVLAVVPTHLFGVPADVEGVGRLIHDPGVTVVEDAAQAMGESVAARKLGTLGDVGFFSLGRGKALSCVEGGIILTNRDDIADALRGVVQRLPRYGLLSVSNLVLKSTALSILSHPRLFWLPRNLPFLKLGETIFDPHFPIMRMSAYQAGLARNWSVKLERLRNIRRRNVMRWLAALHVARIEGVYTHGGQALGLPRLPVRIEDAQARRSLLRESASRGLGVMPVYPASVSAIPQLKGAFGSAVFPAAERCVRELVTLPTHAFLTEDDVASLGKVVSGALGSAVLSGQG